MRDDLTRIADALERIAEFFSLPTTKPVDPTPETGSHLLRRGIVPDVPFLKHDGLSLKAAKILSRGKLVGCRIEDIEEVDVLNIRHCGIAATREIMAWKHKHLERLRKENTQ